VVTQTVSYERRAGKTRSEACVSEQGLRFDGSVPVEIIALAVPEALRGEDYEVIAEKVTHRLAQRPRNLSTTLRHRCLRFSERSLRCST
jgi:transposase